MNCDSFIRFHLACTDSFLRTHSWEFFERFRVSIQNYELIQSITTEFQMFQNMLDLKQLSWVAATFMQNRNVLADTSDKSELRVTGNLSPTCVRHAAYIA